MPFNFKTCQYYKLDIECLLKKFYISKKHKEKIRDNFNSLDEKDRENKFPHNSQSEIKQVMDMETTMYNHYFNLTFNVDKILIFCNKNINSIDISLKDLTTVITDESNFQNKLCSNEPILVYARPFTCHSSKKINYMCSIVDGNHRVHYHKLNNLKFIQAILIDYNFLTIFNPFDSLSEWFLSILFEEIYQYQNKNFVQKIFYSFPISTSSNILSKIPSN